MHRQPNQTAKRVTRVEKSPEGSVAKRSKDKTPSSRRNLSPSEIREVWNGLEVLEVRVTGLFAVAGERAAVAAVMTIMGFVVLVLNDVHVGVCMAEGVLGTGLAWMLSRNAKRKNPPKP